MKDLSTKTLLGILISSIVALGYMLFDDSHRIGKNETGIAVNKSKIENQDEKIKNHATDHRRDISDVEREIRKLQ